MRAVFICYFNPWTLSGGALIRNTWMIRTLASRYDVDLITADDPLSEVPRDFADACNSIWRFPCGSGAVDRLRRTIQALRPDASFYTSGNTVTRLRDKVRELMLPKDSFAILDLRMVEALPGMRYPFVYNAHNAEHSLFSRRADHERQPVRSLIRLESARIRRIEAKAVLNARLIAACSDNDRRELVDLAPQSDSKVVVMPNGVDTRRYSPIADAACEPRTILLSGSYHWRPNLIGLEWFLAEVLPLLRARMPGGGYAIRVAGRMKPDVVERLRRYPDVTAVPDPPDMRDELERAAIVAAPVLVSSGTRLRILEAWAAGRPVVTTSPGALGLTCRDGQELLLADTPVEFAHAICRLLDDAALWRHIHDVALVHARAYDWMRLGAEFLDRAAPLLG